jgi:hypothetical protein
MFEEVDGPQLALNVGLLELRIGMTKDQPF